MTLDFELYLRDYCFEDEGILDDDLQDSFHDWLGNLDTEELICFADSYGNKCYKEALKHILITNMQPLSQDHINNCNGCAECEE